MPAFAYTVVVAGVNQVDEVYGVLFAENIDVARQQLELLGCPIREIRLARQEELTIHSLRRLRKRLTGGEPKVLRVRDRIRSTISGLYFLFIVVVIILTVLACFA